MMIKASKTEAFSAAASRSRHSRGCVLAFSLAYLGIYKRVEENHDSARMSARRVPTPPTTELKFNYLNNPNKVLIENKDLQFLELGSEMRINTKTPKQQKDKFWNKINSRIENEMVKARVRNLDI